MAFFIKPLITLTLEFSTFSGRNCWLTAARIGLINELSVVKPVVSQKAAVFDIDMFQDRNRIVDIITLLVTDHYVNGVAICIYSIMYFCTDNGSAVLDFVRESRFFWHCNLKRLRWTWCACPYMTFRAFQYIRVETDVQCVPILDLLIHNVLT